MRDWIKIILRQAGVFAGTFVLLLLLLLGAALIPKSAIRSNMEKSSELLCENIVFYNLQENINGSKIDRYADSILLSIAYQMSGGNPLRKAMEAAYYYSPYKNENDNFRESLMMDYEPNQQYIRYWHGSVIFVKLFHLFGSLKAMYICNAILMAVLFCVLEWMLLRGVHQRGQAPVAQMHQRGQAPVVQKYLIAASLAVALIAVSVWFVPYSLEYTWTFLMMFAVSIIGILFVRKGHENRLFSLFLISGMVTSFLDFLPTETLTLLVPLLLVSACRESEDDDDKSGRLCTKGARPLWCICTKGARPLWCSLLWAVGYVGMWVMKWVLASVVLRENVMQYVSGHVSERIGDTEEFTLLEYMRNAVGRNGGCLFPAEYGPAGKVIPLVVLFILVAFVVVFRRKKIDFGRIALYAAIGLVPYVRYIMLRNHSYLHFFFTYRAQAATVLALFMILWEIIELRRTE